MGQVQGSPTAVFKPWIYRSSRSAAGFRKNIGDTIIEIFIRIGCISEMKFPVLVDIYFFTNAGLCRAREKNKNRKNQLDRKLKFDVTHGFQSKRNLFIGKAIECQRRFSIHIKGTQPISLPVI